MMKILQRIAFILAIGLSLSACKKEETNPNQNTPNNPGGSGNSDDPKAPAQTTNVNMGTGNPSGATRDASETPNNYFIERDQYVMSFSKERGTANWVSWHLGKEDLGSQSRTNDWTVDNSLPSGFYKAPTKWQYSTYGFDRGHMCPSADRTASRADNESLFIMSNIIPQSPNNNQKAWNNMESDLRDLVTSGNKELYIIMGVYGKGGTGGQGFFEKILDNKMTVPARIWKVALVLDSKSGDDMARVTNSTRVIAVDTPNDQTPTTDWKKYRVSVDAIEEATGYDLFSNIPKEIQDVIEAKVDNQ